MTFTTHRHTPNRVKWNWATDRIEHFCTCGLKVADDWDEASYGPPPVIWNEATTAVDCGQSWLIDLAYGTAMFAAAFLIFSAALWLS